MIKKLLWSFFLVLSLSACDVTEESEESGNYSRDIQPIFDKSCNFSGCHAETGAAFLKPLHGDSTLHLSSYISLAAGTESNGGVIVPFQPSLSHLFQHVSRNAARNPFAEPQMPLNLDPLSSTDLNRLYEWILDGAPDDTGIPMYSSSVSGDFLITNQGDDFLSLIDSRTGIIRRIFPLSGSTWPVPASAPSAPHYVSINKAGTKALVTFYTAGQLLEVDLQSGSVLRRLTLGGTPAHVEYFPDEKRAAVTNFSALNKLHIIDLLSFTVEKDISNLQSNPHALQIMPNGNTIYTAGQASDLLYKIDVNAGDVESFILSNRTPPTGATSPEFGPYQIRYADSSNSLFISCKFSGEVRKFNLSTNSVTDSFTVGKNPLLFDFHPTRPELWVANQGDSSVSVINLSVKTVETITDLPNQPHGIAFSPDGFRVGITCENLTGGADQHHPTTRGGKPGILVIMNPGTRTILFERSTGSFAAGIDFLR